MIERTFDARPSLDPRNANYPIAPLLAPITRPRSYTWSCPVRLDQGREGSCVGHGWAHELAAKPKPKSGMTHAFAVQLYQEAQHVDEWPGSDYEGTSVNAGAKVVRGLGFLDEWRWATNIVDTIFAVGHRGPVVLGVPWYEGMFDTDVKGFIRPDGEVLGGHCVILNGVRVDRTDLARSTFSGVNSWGTGWGVSGQFLLTARDLGLLLDDGGEVCVPVLRR